MTWLCSRLFRASAIVVFFLMTLGSVTAVALTENLSASAYLIYDTSYYDGELFANEDLVNERVSDLRRLKISAKYKFTKSFAAKISTKYDVDESAFVLDDAYLVLDVGSNTEVKAGKFKEPFGLEAMQSFKYQYQRERSVATNALTFSRENGLGVGVGSKKWHWDLAIMQLKAEDPGYEDGLAYTTRLTVAPIVKKKKFLHFGAGYSIRDGVEKKYDIDEPVIAHGVGNLMHSANIRVKSITAGNLEFAASYKSLLLQSELLFQDIEDINKVSHQFGGYYTSVLWTLRGRPRVYGKGEVLFAKPKKQTVELALRYSMVDIESHWDGEIAEVISLSLNYYIKNALRLSLDYEHANLKSFDPKAWDTRSKGDAVSARLQLML